MSVNTAEVDYQSVSYPYQRHVDQDAKLPAQHPVVVVGAGPVGLSLAIDLALQDVPVVLLDNSGSLSVGSRALCFAKRTLEIFDRLGCGQRMVDKGVSWNRGRVFFHDEQVYQFNLLPEPGHQRPAFVNIQQYYVEGYLVERAMELPKVDIRWHNEVIGLTQKGDHVDVQVQTPEGLYAIQARYVVACDGARSPVRKMMGQESKGRVFKDRFLIADVRMSAPFPAERWFWFDPPFHPGQSVLLHMQPDGVWRIDFQLGWDADPEVEKREENILPRVRELMAQASKAAGGTGELPEIELVWASVYTFACMRMDDFRHGRVLFAGDSAHGVSPFGARGANSGVQDADNLGWKLAWVLGGRAPEQLLDSYASEREYAADENILNSSRATDFITPKSDISRVFRDAVLDLSKGFEFARRLVNSGRLSLPSTLDGSVLNTLDDTLFQGVMRPGAPAADAPVHVNGKDEWLLTQTRTGHFTALVFAGESQQAGVDAVRDAFEGEPAPEVLLIAADPSAAAQGARTVVDSQGFVAQRYDGLGGTVVLLRPDQHVCARWRQTTAQQVRAAMQRALALA